MRWGGCGRCLCSVALLPSPGVLSQGSREVLFKAACSAVRTLFCTSKQYFKGSLWLLSLSTGFYITTELHLVPGTFNHLESMKRL